MEARNGVNKTVLLGATILSSFFNPFMGAAVNVALKEIGSDFSMHAVSLSWIAMAYLMSAAIFLVPFGKITDMVGRKKIFQIGNIILLIGSVLCAISTTGDYLIAFRFVQGIGSSMIFCSGMAMVISAFPPQMRGKVIGYNVSAVYLGLSAAPFLGGIMTKFMGWRSIFMMNAIAGSLIIVLVYFKIKKDWVDQIKGRFDYIGSLFYMMAIASLMYGISKVPESVSVYYISVGLILFIAFVRIELKQGNPVLEINLFLKSRTFAFSNMAALINYAATFALSFILSMYLRFVKGLPPHVAGSVLMVQPVLMAIVAFFSGGLSDRKDPRVLSSMGMSISVIGLFLFIFLDVSTPYYYMIISLALLGIGFGLFSSPNTNAIMGAVEKRYLGVASATVSTMRLTGQMLSMATATMVINYFIGDEKITPQNFPRFIQSTQTLFIIFTALCFAGVFASMARGKKGA